MINQTTVPTTVMNGAAISPTLSSTAVQFPVYWFDMSMTWAEATMTWREATDITSVTNL